MDHDAWSMAWDVVSPSYSCILPLLRRFLGTVWEMVAERAENALDEQALICSFNTCSNSSGGPGFGTPLAQNYTLASLCNYLGELLPSLFAGAFIAAASRLRRPRSSDKALAKRCTIGAEMGVLTCCGGAFQSPKPRPRAMKAKTFPALGVVTSELRCTSDHGSARAAPSIRQARCRGEGQVYWSRHRWKPDELRATGYSSRILDRKTRVARTPLIPSASRSRCSPHQNTIPANIFDACVLRL